MWPSRLLLLTAILAAGCSRQGPDESALAEADSATFLVQQPISGVAQETAVAGSFAGVPRERSFTFTACLRDVAVVEPIVGAAFRLRDGSREIAMRAARTDAKGCLYWSETIPFRATDAETYFEVERTIESTSGHRGAVRVRLALNPWKKGGEAVKDLRAESAPSGLKSLPGEATATQESSGGPNGLLVEAVETELEFVRSANAVAETNFRLAFEPKIRRVGLDGAPVAPEAIQSGKFRVRAQLFARTATGVVPVTGAIEFPAVTSKRGTVELREKVALIRRIPRESTLEIAFDCEPLEAPAGFRTVSGRASLGRLASLSLSRKAALREEPANFAALAENKPETEAAAFNGFDIGRVQVSDVVVKKLDSSGKPQLLELAFRACLTNSISQEAVRNQKFTVALDGQSQDQTTESDTGCLRWKQDFPFDFFAAETFVKKTLKVTSANEYYGHDEQTRLVHLNLWKFESPGSVALDDEKDGAPSASVADTAGAAELTIANVGAAFVNRSFEIDGHLNFTVVRRYAFEITPRIRRMSRNRGWLPPDGIGNGRFLVRVLLETADPNHPRVVDAFSTEIESRNDTITVEVPFRFRDPRLILARMQLSVEVQALGRNASLRTQPYRGPMEPLNSFFLRLQPREGKIDHLMAPGENALLAENAAHLFARARSHEMLSSERLASLGTSQSELDAYLAGKNPAFAAKLCDLYFDPKGWFTGSRSCRNNPEGSLALVQTQHVHKIRAAKLNGAIQSSSIGWNAGFSTSSGESEDESFSRSQSKSWDSGVRMSVPLIKLIGLDIGTGVGTSDSWGHSKSHGRSKNRGRSRGAEQSRSLHVDEASFDLQAEVDRCLVVANRAADGKGKTYFLCASAPVARTIKESYYLIAQGVSAGPLTDAGASLDERPLISLVRGTKRFEEFRRLLQDPDVMLNLTNELPVPGDLMRRAEQRYDGYFPGLLTP